MRSPNTHLCRVCKGALFPKPILTLPKMPSSAQGFLAADELDTDLDGRLDLKQCSMCSLVQLDCLPVPYFREVIRASAYSSEMMDFRLKQLKGWVELESLREKHVLEIGCANGEFLELLSKCGVHAVGLEGSLNSVNECRLNKHNVYHGYLGDDIRIKGLGKFDAFICLNFLEHWPDPLKGLRNLHHYLKDNAIGIIEVPNFDMILKTGKFSELISDHLLYFTGDSLRMLLEIAGFEVISTDILWNEYSLSCRVVKRIPLNADYFIDEMDKTIGILKKFVTQFKKEEVVVWGAGHQSLALLSLSQLENKVDCVIDSAVFKQGKYTPGSHLFIVSPNYLEGSKTKAILIMCGSYSKEVECYINDRYPNRFVLKIV